MILATHQKTLSTRDMLHLQHKIYQEYKGYFSLFVSLLRTVPCRLVAHLAGMRRCAVCLSHQQS